MRRSLALAVAGLFLVLPGSASSQGDPLLVTDPTGDVAYDTWAGTVEPPADVPPNPDSGPVDLVGMAVTKENLTAFRIEVEVAQAYSPVNQVDSFFFYHFQTAFQVEGARVQYDLRATFSLSHFFVSDPSHVVAADYAYLCLLPSDASIDTASSGCYQQHAAARWDFGTNRVIWDVPKLALTGAVPPATPITAASTERPGGIPDDVPPGTVLSGFAVRSMQNRAFATINSHVVGWIDHMPDDGPSPATYVTQHPTADARVRLALDGWQGPPSSDVYAVGVPAGVDWPVALRLENANPAKRLVNLDVAPGPGDLIEASRLVPTLEIPSNDHRVVDLVLRTAAGAEAGQRQSLTVRADAVGYPDEVGLLRLQVVVAPPVDADNARLHLHASDNRTFAFEADGTGVCDPMEGCGGGQFRWLNTMPDDPRANVDEEGYARASLALPATPFFEFAWWSEYVRMDAPLADDLHFDPSRPAVMHLTVESETELTSTVTTRLLIDPASGCPVTGCSSRVALGDGSEPVTFEAGTNVFEVPMPVIAESPRVPGQGRIITYYFQLDTEDYVGTTDAWARDFRIIPAGSWLDLPLTSAPARAAPSNLSVRAAAGLEEFVNPGTTRAFHVIVLNQASDERPVRVEATVDEDGWSARVEPASRFLLPAGGAVNITVLAKAPSKAGEGDRATINVSAVAADDHEVRAALGLTAVVTSGVDLKDEGDDYAVDPETAGRAERDDEADASGPGLALLAISAVVAVFVTRPRRKGL